MLMKNSKVIITILSGKDKNKSVQCNTDNGEITESVISCLQSKLDKECPNTHLQLELLK